MMPLHLPPTMASQTPPLPPPFASSPIHPHTASSLAIPPLNSLSTSSTSTTSTPATSNNSSSPHHLYISAHTVQPKRTKMLPSSRGSKQDIHAPDETYEVRFKAFELPDSMTVPPEQVALIPRAADIVQKKYSTSVDPRYFLTVYQYSINGQLVMWDYYTGYVHLTGLWKAIGNSKADIVKLVDNSPDLEPLIRRVRGGFLKIQGTWLPFDTAKALASRTCYTIRYALVCIFGPDFPDSCLKPHEPGFGQLQLHLSATKRRRPRQTPTQTPAQTPAQATSNTSTPLPSSSTTRPPPTPSPVQSPSRSPLQPLAKPLPPKRSHPDPTTGPAPKRQFSTSAAAGVAYPPPALLPTPPPVSQRQNSDDEDDDLTSVTSTAGDARYGHGDDTRPMATGGRSATSTPNSSLSNSPILAAPTVSKDTPAQPLSINSYSNYNPWLFKPLTPPPMPSKLVFPDESALTQSPSDFLLALQATRSLQQLSMLHYGDATNYDYNSAGASATSAAAVPRHRPFGIKAQGGGFECAGKLWKWDGHDQLAIVGSAIDADTNDTGRRKQHESKMTISNLLS